MKRFTKQVENFICANCGAIVTGNGYTNHCPHCLWSKHVDVLPGDRASECGGMMEPILAEPNGADFIITHKCTKCGRTKRQKSSDSDNMEKIIALTTNQDFIFGK